MTSSKTVYIYRVPSSQGHSPQAFQHSRDRNFSCEAKSGLETSYKVPTLLQVSPHVGTCSVHANMYSTVINILNTSFEHARPTLTHQLTLLSTRTCSLSISRATTTPTRMTYSLTLMVTTREHLAADLHGEVIGHTCRNREKANQQ